jgi:hypothetical protein
VTAESVSVVEIVQRASARERARARITVALLALALLAVVAAIAVWILGDGRWVSLPPMLPVALLLVIAVPAVVMAVLGWARADAVANAQALARAAEREHTLRRGSLAGLLEIERANPFAQRSAARIGEVLPARGLAPIRERRVRRLLVAGAGVLGAAFLGFAWSGVRNADAIGVLLHPVQAARGDLLPPLKLAAAVTTLERGAPLVLEVTAPARRWITVHSRAAGSPWRVTRHELDGGMARVALGSMDAATTVFASDGRSNSDTVRFRVLERPFIRALALEAIYPPVLRRRNEPLPASGQLILPEGTVVRVQGRASVLLADAELQGPGGSVTLEAAGEAFTGALLVRRSGTYEWRLRARSGDAVEPPLPLQIAVLGDLLPDVQIVTPGADTTVSGEHPVLVSVRASDDHGLASVALHIRSDDSRRVVDLAIPPAGGTAAMAVDVATLAPGSRLSIHAVAVELGGGRQVASAPRAITIMTAAEQRAAARRAADTAATLAAGLATAQRQAERRTTETAQARGSRREAGQGEMDAAGHALASRARSLVDEQRSLMARAESLAAATRSLEARLGRAGSLDDGLAARLAEVRSLLERALTPELAARLRDAERAASDNSEEPLRRALGDVAREQRRAREQLERVVRMLRRAAIEGSLETLRTGAIDIAAEAAAPDAEARTRRLGEDVGMVIERLTAENARAGVAPAHAAAELAGAAADALGRGDGAAGATALKQTAERLDEARNAQIAEWKEELAADLDAAVQELVQLAAMEEALARRVTGGSNDWREDHAIAEASAAAVADRISRAALSSSLVSSRSDGLVRAARDRVISVSAPSFPPRDRTQTSARMRDAAGALTRAAASLVRDRERTNAARSASGFTELLEELQRLASQQRGLNAATAGLPLDLLARGSAATRETARTLARQQRAIARALEELGDADGGARAQPLASEAGRLADALERATVDGSVIARQERLYHRLLEGGRLLTGDSGEEDERREAVAARSTDFPVLDRGAVPVGARHRVPGWAELSALTPAERQMIVEYFERLNGGR